MIKTYIFNDNTIHVIQVITKRCDMMMKMWNDMITAKQQVVGDNSGVYIEQTDTMTTRASTSNTCIYSPSTIWTKIVATMYSFQI